MRKVFEKKNCLFFKAEKELVRETLNSNHFKWNTDSFKIENFAHASLGGRDRKKQNFLASLELILGIWSFWASQS